MQWKRSGRIGAGGGRLETAQLRRSHLRNGGKKKKQRRKMNGASETGWMPPSAPVCVQRESLEGQKGAERVSEKITAQINPHLMTNAHLKPRSSITCKQEKLRETHT